MNGCNQPTMFVPPGTLCSVCPTRCRLPATGDRVTFVYRDCGCRAKWAGDELTVTPCEAHALEWRCEALLTKYAGPPTLTEPPPIGRPNYGDN